MSSPAHQQSAELRQSARRPNGKALSSSKYDDLRQRWNNDEADTLGQKQFTRIASAGRLHSKHNISGKEESKGNLSVKNGELTRQSSSAETHEYPGNRKMGDVRKYSGMHVGSEVKKMTPNVRQADSRLRDAVNEGNTTYNYDTYASFSRQSMNASRAPVRDKSFMQDDEATAFYDDPHGFRNSKVGAAHIDDNSSGHMSTP